MKARSRDARDYGYLVRVTLKSGPSPHGDTYDVARAWSTAVRAMREAKRKARSPLVARVRVVRFTRGVAGKEIVVADTNALAAAWRGTEAIGKAE